MWFGPTERNTQCPWRECCITVCVALFKAQLNLVSPAVYPTFYSSRPGSHTMTQGPTGGPRVVGSLYSRDYRLEVANDVFNGVGMPGLIVLSCHARSAAWCHTVGLPCTVAVPGKWSAVLWLHYSHTVAACLYIVHALTTVPARTSCSPMMAMTSGTLEMCTHALGIGEPCCTGRPARLFFMFEARGP
jgi:hypothetical protein